MSAHVERGNTCKSHIYHRNCHTFQKKLAKFSKKCWCLECTHFKCALQTWTFLVMAFSVISPRYSLNIVAFVFLNFSTPWPSSIRGWRFLTSYNRSHHRGSGLRLGNIYIIIGKAQANKTYSWYFVVYTKINIVYLKNVSNKRVYTQL